MTCATCGSSESPCGCIMLVCPGCYAFGPERCAPWCIDDEIRREQERDRDVDDYEEAGSDASWREAWTIDQEDEAW